MVPDDPLAPVARALGLTRAGMVAERMARALWLPVSLALIGATLWAFDLQTRLPGDAALWVVLALVLGILVTLALGLWRFRWPTRGEAITGLDRTLAGRPLAALTDPQAINAGDAASVALWQAHRARMRGAGGEGAPPGAAPARTSRGMTRLPCVWWR